MSHFNIPNILIEEGCFPALDAELESNLPSQQLEKCHQCHPDVARGHEVQPVPA